MPDTPKPRIRTLLGFDYGTRKIGVAVGQVLTGTATPLETLQLVNHKPDWQRIGQLIDEWQPDALVVGLPLDVDDSETDATQPALRFSRQLEGRFRLMVHMADERFTSFEARDRLGHRAKRLEDYDAVAAKLILETWLNLN
ncbi:MAG: Holliday junction resolvase RuvX [Candidatus Thiodiazotropha sp.]|jgi:putative holliday junction resolvase